VTDAEVAMLAKPLPTRRGRAGLRARAPRLVLVVGALLGTSDRWGYETRVRPTGLGQRIVLVEIDIVPTRAAERTIAEHSLERSIVELAAALRSASDDERRDGATTDDREQNVA
jgi:hypothetical protein